MTRTRQSAQTRTHLDKRFQEMGSPKKFTVPIHGWIKAIRGGLGMSAQQLGKRLGITQPSVVAMEKSEAKGSIELATLRRVAEALDCTLVYALVPNKPLETIVRDRARVVLRRRRSHVEHSMLLEDQAVSTPIDEAQLDEYIRSISPGRLWDET